MCFQLKKDKARCKFKIDLIFVNWYFIVVSNLEKSNSIESQKPNFKTIPN